MAGRITLGLYNSYDPKAFHEAMRRAIARAAPLAAAFDLNLALFGFPFDAYETKTGERPRPRTPRDLAALVADSTTIGEGGQYLLELAAEDRFQSYAFPEKGVSPQLGIPVLATREPDPKKRIHLDEIATRHRKGERFVVLVGLGPRGVPKNVHELCRHHLELTGRNYSLETATALGVLVGKLASAVDRTYQEGQPRVTVDVVVTRGDSLLLIRRGREPFMGMWCLPGGFVDAGETLEQAAVRELLEETGLRGKKLEWVAYFDDPRRDPRFQTLGHVFSAQAEGEPKGGDDAAEARFHALSQLPPLGFDHAEILDVYRRRKK